MTFTEVSLEPQGRRDAGRVQRLAVASDGRSVAFVPGDSDRIYLRDVRAGSTTQVGVCASGRNIQGTPHCDLRLSANGRYLAFTTERSLAAGDTNGKADVYRMDLTTRKSTLVSTRGGSGKGAGGLTPAISADGATISFGSAADLDPDRPNSPPPGGRGAQYQVFVRDLKAGTTRLASVGAQGAPGNAQSGELLGTEISPDGNWVAFHTSATNVGSGLGAVAVKDLRSADPAFLVDDHLGYRLPEGNVFKEFSAPTDGGRMALRIQLQSEDGTNLGSVNEGRMLVVDLKAGRILRTVTNVAGRAVTSTTNPALSADGRTLAFRYPNKGLVPGDDNNRADVFALDVDSGAISILTRRWCKPVARRDFACQVYPAGISADGRTVLITRDSYPEPDFDSEVSSVFVARRR